MYCYYGDTGKQVEISDLIGSLDKTKGYSAELSKKLVSNL